MSDLAGGKALGLWTKPVVPTVSVRHGSGSFCVAWKVGSPLTRSLLRLGAGRGTITAPTMAERSPTEPFGAPYGAPKTADLQDFRR
jgi:hypothetical protein